MGQKLVWSFPYALNLTAKMELIQVFLGFLAWDGRL